MGDVVILERTTGSSPSRSNVILPVWPHSRTVTLSIEQARAIDRDMRHLDQVMARMRDVRTISMILSTICGPELLSKDETGPAERAARAIGLWLRSGDDSWRIWAG